MTSTPATAALPKPVLSIIMVTFNAQDVVEKTLASVAAQDQSALELVCIDGCSRDDTLRKVEAYGARIPGLRIVSEPDDSLYDAMNKGLAQAHGDYVLFLNAGDFFADDAVAADLAALLREQIGPPPTLIYGHTELDYPNGLRRIRPVRRLGYIAHGQPTMHQSVFFRTEAHRQCLYRYHEFPISADYAAMAELQRRAEDRVLVWDRSVAVFTFEPTSVSNRNLRRRLVDAWVIQKDILRVSLVARLSSAARRVLAHVYHNARGARPGPSS